MSQRVKPLIWKLPVGMGSVLPKPFSSTRCLVRTATQWTGHGLVYRSIFLVTNSPGEMWLVDSMSRGSCMLHGLSIPRWRAVESDQSTAAPTHDPQVKSYLHQYARGRGVTLWCSCTFVPHWLTGWGYRCGAVAPLWDSDSLISLEIWSGTGRRDVLLNDI